jgi:hypothetical protein
MRVRFYFLAVYCIIKRVYRQQMLIWALLLLLLYLSLLLFQEFIGLFAPGLEPDLCPTRLLNVLLPLVTEVIKLFELLLSLSRKSLDLPYIIDIGTAFQPLSEILIVNHPIQALHEV